MLSEHFIYDGIKSADMGIYIIQTYSGFVTSPFFGGQDVTVEINRNRITPYHNSVKKRPIEFTVELSPLDEEWTPQFRKK